MPPIRHKVTAVGHEEVKGKHCVELLMEVGHMMREK